MRRAWEEVRLWEKVGRKRERTAVLRVSPKMGMPRRGDVKGKVGVSEKRHNREPGGDGRPSKQGRRRMEAGRSDRTGREPRDPLPADGPEPPLQEWGREDSPRTRFSGSLMLTVWSWEADKELLMERSAVGPMESAQDKALSRGSSHHRAWRPRPGVPGPRVTKGPQVQIPRGEETD